jgi:hypothetical protein
MTSAPTISSARRTPATGNVKPITSAAPPASSITAVPGGEPRSWHTHLGERGRGAVDAPLGEFLVAVHYKDHAKPDPRRTATS